MGAFGAIGAGGLLFGLRGNPARRAKKGSSLNVRGEEAFFDDPELAFFRIAEVPKLTPRSDLNPPTYPGGFFVPVDASAGARSRIPKIGPVGRLWICSEFCAIGGL